VIMLERGRVLADETPAALIRRFGRATLEEVFLDIARRRTVSQAAHPSREERRKDETEERR
jgi:ABC-2 type transport system ATP-binding protein